MLCTTRVAALAIVAVAAASCTTPPRTTPLTSIGAEPQYDYVDGAGRAKDDTLFVVTASGGGTRAAALTLGTLRALDDVKMSGAGGSLATEVDIISSVSGGSVTAAYFALKGPQGFDYLDQHFIRRNGIDQLILRALNPFTLARLQTDSYSRLDPLIDYFNDVLFHDATYSALLGRRPYLILNAADMSGGTVFSFTQPQFDLLCADLVKFQVADAVAASAAFPVALAPLALRDYSPCDAQLAKSNEFTGPAPSVTRQPRWPPLWVQNAVTTSIESNPDRVRRGRAALSYLNLDCGYPFDAHKCQPMNDNERKLWIHLLDGGIADNLGLNEPLRLISTVDVSPPFLNKIFQGNIKNLIFVVVNARSEADFGLDQSGATPGILKMLSASTGSSIDAASFGMLDQLDALTKELLRLQAGNVELFRRTVERLRIFVIPVDFDYIGDPQCRRYFKNIATSWKLDDADITALNDIAGALVRQSRNFGAVLQVYGVSPPTGPTVKDVCARTTSAISN